MRVAVFFGSIALTCFLFGFLAWHAWRKREIPGSRAYAGLALGECLLALAEMLSMISADRAEALLWFKFRYTALAAVAVVWLLFALEYSGRKRWLTKKFLSAVILIPAVGQVLLWTGRWHSLWSLREPSFRKIGAFWLADVRDRLPGPGFLIHSFYSLALVSAGIVLLLVAAWGKRKRFRAQAALVAAAAITASAASFFFAFNVLPRIEFNLTTPGIGISGLFIALAVFRFGFLKSSPSDPGSRDEEAVAPRSPAALTLIFILLATAITSVGYLSFLRFRDNIMVEASEQLESVAMLKAVELEGWRRNRLADADLLSRIPTFHRLARRILANPADEQARNELRDWLEGYEIYGQYDRIFLLDAGGVERISFLAPSDHVPAHVQEIKDEVLREGRIQFLDFHRDTEDGAIHLSILVPILPESPPNESPGLLVLRIDPYKYLFPFIAAWPVPSESAETLLVRREGDDVVFLNELRFLPDAALKARFPLKNERLPAAMAALGKSGVVEGEDYRGTEVIASLRAVTGTPWFIVARIDKSEIYAPVTQRLLQTLLVLVALIAGSGAGLAAVWRRQRLGDFRQLAETARALSKSERLLRDIAANFPRSYVSIIERDLTVGYTSGQEFKKQGLDPSAFVGLTLEKVFGEKAAFVREHYLQAFGGQEVEFELHINNQHQLYRAVPMLNERGAVERVLVVAENVTERKRFEEMLVIRNEIADHFLTSDDVEMYSRVLDIILRAMRSPLGVLGYLDESGDLVVPSMTRHVGDRCLITEKTTVFPRGQWGNSAWPTAIREKRVIVSNDPSTATPEGHVVIRRHITVPIIFNKEVTGLVQVANKETGYTADDVRILEEIGSSIAPILSARLQRAKAMESLRMLSVRQQALLSAVPDIIMEVDRNKVYTWANRAGLEFFGGDVLGKEASFYFVAVQSTYEVVQPLFKGDEETIYVESWQRRKDGQARLLAWWCRGLKDKDGNVTGAISSAMDITDRKRQENDILAAQAELKRLFDEAEQARRVLLSVVEDQKAAEEEVRKLNVELEQRIRYRTAQLEAANKELEAFAYSASHDLRAPLRGIDGWSMALLEDYHHQLDDEARSYLNRIRSETQRLGHLIDDLLHFSRETRGELNLQTVDMTALAQTVISRIKTDHPAADVEFIIRPGLRARGDARLLEIALGNLLDNAVKFSGSRSPARVEFGRTVGDGRNAFYVRDNGVGFDMTYAPKLFKMFQRLHSSAEFPGTGVGLATVHNIINRHGGRLWAKSEPGEGATFYFTLEEPS